MKTITVLAALLIATVGASAETLQGRWKIVAAEDLRPDGTVARYPWGRHPIGGIVVQGGSCYVQIMSSDVPDFSATDTSANDQMKASLLSSYIAYTGPCTFDDAKGTTTMKVEAAWRPNYVGTEQTRFYRFEGNRMLYGPAQNSIRGGAETLTRRLTLERP
jgi:Lipocalin-like domain